MDKFVIFDLDGTLADIQERKDRATKKDGSIDWDILFDPKLIKTDKPIPSVIETYKVLSNAGYKMIIMTGRDGRTKRETQKWLAENGIIPDYLIMRNEGDTTPDNELKDNWIEDLFDSGVSPDEILCVYEDRDRVVDMWRKKGIECFQVAEGKF